MSEELRPDVLAAWVLFIAAVVAVLVGVAWLVRRVVEGGNKCPACRGRVPRGASRCLHCGEGLVRTW